MAEEEATVSDQATPRTDVRARVVEVARWAIRHERRIHYAELRPIDGLHRPHKLPLWTDCSGFVTLCYAWAGAPDPNGLGYSGAGYTGTLLAHMRPITLEAARPADVVVWGPAPGRHAALVLEADADPLLCSHGQERGPFAVRFSAEDAVQSPPAVFLSCLSSSPVQASEPGAGSAR